MVESLEYRLTMEGRGVVAGEVVISEMVVADSHPSASEFEEGERKGSRNPRWWKRAEVEEAAGGWERQ
ncbi:hypothetical protein HPP92_004572 [Vanilla planifolia]|uniref:Uncharacterized protein n=1 Tax=Vanilla planifolia TaxID=51239 RepID=A0A835RX03_VANPL|nr:hypothetical protein HPP92_004572 [Vanilla planifolia]